MPEIGMLEVLDFVRFLKAQLDRFGPEERFDRAWMASRRWAVKHGITDADIAAEIRSARREQ
jgi:hypothetical protein